MSSREKNLLIFFSIAGFAILNLLAFNFGMSKRREVAIERDQARVQLANAEKFRESSAQIIDQMEWLAQHEPQPSTNQDVQTKLQQLGEREAGGSGLTLKSQKPLPTDTTGTHYHRANFQFVVTGTEDSLYRWFDKLNVPDQFRVASQINMKPNQQDDTKIDCTATVSQWFVPPPTL